MSDLFALPVVSVVEIAARQILLVLDARGTPVHSSHVTAGQHLLLQLLDDDVPRPFALANAPDASGRLEFLIKVPEDRMPRVLALLVGDKLPASACIGRGFPFDIVRHVPGGADLWLCGVGSGVAPLRAAIEFLVSERQRYGDITLLYGVRTPDEIVFSSVPTLETKPSQQTVRAEPRSGSGWTVRDRFGVWAGLGVRVVPVVSRPAGTSWTGATGYVQEQLPSSFARPMSTHAFVCGLPDMEKATCAALAARGVGPDHVHRNW